MGVGNLDFSEVWWGEKTKILVDARGAGWQTPALRCHGESEKKNPIFFFKGCGRGLKMENKAWLFLLLGVGGSDGEKTE